MKDSGVTASEHGSSPALRAQEEVLRDFCRKVIQEYCWGYSSNEADGGDIQDMAEKLGLIVPAIATAEDAEHMDCVDAGDTIYRFADWLNEPRGLSAAEGSSKPEGVNP
jgi:hypothetical protein